MNSHVPGSDSSLTGSKRSSRHRRVQPTSTRTTATTSIQQQQNPKKKKQRNTCFGWISSLFTHKAPTSARGQRYGFSQNDADDHAKAVPSDYAEAEKEEKRQHEEMQYASKTGTEKKEKKQRRRDRIKDSASRRAQHIIQSVNFGDKNFASQWMRDSFDDVAISHPAFDRLISLVVSSQTRALVRSIMKLANAFGQGFKVTSFRLLKAMIILERYYKSLPRPPPSREIKDRELMDEACHYFDYALMAYGWRGLCYLGSYGQYMREARHPRSNRLAIMRFLKLHPEDLLGYEYGLRKGAVFQPSYFVAIDRSRKAIVLSIRGTWSLYDAITDLVCEYKPFKGGLVHAGMLASAQWFYTNIIPQIFRYIHHHSNELSSFIITGHSLGGGAASLLTMLVSEQIAVLRRLSNNPNFQLHCYSYAPVALSSRELNHKYDKYIHSFICQDDIVGRMSYGTAMELKELIMDTISAYETLGGWHKVMTDPATRKVCFEILTRCRDRIYHSVDQLYPLVCSFNSVFL
ncbi:Alpha/Beta hydrolase protein [Zychaea mexicana]|uniref:Alpha/Beta hydrolase protein n=1 Tax=Zychaea mexicana TaxID=64656 RepID=UPI0022FDFF52|nr:Alpha/Beta hydrolase protein [Zychaea mexicana]KAI9492223.1 Alpha/Beta hydrolase protein [Zychaea mexicana]